MGKLFFTVPVDGTTIAASLLLAQEIQIWESEGGALRVEQAMSVKGKGFLDTEAPLNILDMN